MSSSELFTPSNLIAAPEVPLELCNLVREFLVCCRFLSCRTDRKSEDFPTAGVVDVGKRSRAPNVMHGQPKSGLPREY